jgi:MFS family permease
MSQDGSKRTINTFALASFLHDFGSDIIYPIWPLFVTTVLGANMAVLGFIDGFGEAIVSLSSAASGYYSDKLKKRKMFIWLGYSFGAVSRVGYAIATVWGWLVPIRALDRFGKIRSAPRDAMVAEVSTDETRGKNFGLLRSMDNFGAVCGITFCIAFFGLGYQTLFLIAAVPSVIAVLLVILFIREPEATTAVLFKGLQLKNLSRDFYLYTISSAIFALGSFSYSFFIMYASKFGFVSSYAPVLYLLFTTVAMFFSLPFGKMSDVIGRKTIIVLSFICWGAAVMCFLWYQTYWGILTGFGLYGLHRAAIEPVQKTFVSELAPNEFRASGLGGFQMVVGLCALPSSLIAGLLWETVDLLAPLYLSLALTVVATIVLLFVKETRVGYTETGAISAEPKGNI